ncbi:hypothetical protein MHB54_00875 [Paenibacillus sp. FSL M7-0802]|uniref:hypothetical protein n=1 Tax=Paenibacillus sp. FSL M7-0802 TaxID=2921536 RepID=UPI0030F9EE00
MGALLKTDNFVEDKNVRDQYIDRTEVLEKVKSLSMLPDKKHMTVRAVADFYEVEYAVIGNMFTRYKKEFQTDGVHTLTSKDEAFNKLTKALPSKQFVVKLLPKRAVLRIGMLLRDSEVAVKVRDYLLKVEETSTIDQKRGVWTDADLITLNEIMKDETNKGNSKWGAIRKAAKVIKKNPHAIYQKYKNVNKKHGTLEKYIEGNNLIYLNKQSKESQEEVLLVTKSTAHEEQQQNIVVGTFQTKMNKMLNDMKNISDLESTIHDLKLEVRDLKHQLEIKEMELSANTESITKKDKMISKYKKEKLTLEASIKAIRKIVLNGVKVNSSEVQDTLESEASGRKFTQDKSGLIQLK